MQFFSSCHNNESPPAKKEISKQDIDYVMKEANTWNKTREVDDINSFIKTHNYNMTETPSGLRYELLKRGSGDEMPVVQDTVVVNYKISLLDGTECYTSDADGAQFVVGKDNVEAGIHEGVQLMHVGDKMRFILPSFLAHGASGDGNKIHPYTPVVYEIELLEVKAARSQVIK